VPFEEQHLIDLQDEVEPQLAKTDFRDICNILGALYLDYKKDEDLKDFIEYNDIGFPLAYLVSALLCEVGDEGVRLITESWNLF